MKDETEPTKKKSQKKKEEKENQEYEEFIEDVMADDEMKKNIMIYKDKDALKHLTKEELDELKDELDLEDLMEDMNLEGE